MAVSNSYFEFIVELLSEIVPIKSRRMFGGVGIYGDGLFFAIIADDILYFKVDDSNRPDYEKQGMAQFMNMQYYQLPADQLEDPDELQEWVDKSLAVAARKRSKSK